MPIDSRTWCCIGVTGCYAHAAHSLVLCIIPGRITMTMTAITIEPDRMVEGAGRQLGKLLTNNAATGGQTAIRRGVVSSSATPMLEIEPVFILSRIIARETPFPRPVSQKIARLLDDQRHDYVNTFLQILSAYSPIKSASLEDETNSWKWNVVCKFSTFLLIFCWIFIEFYEYRMFYRTYLGNFF